MILDYLFRGSSYLTDKNWSTKEFLNQVQISPEWFEPMEDDPLEEILRACLSEPKKRPQTPAELKTLLLTNEEISRYLVSNPNHEWATNSTESEPEENIPFEAETDDPEADEDSRESGLAVGIDLGTSNSVVAYYQAGKYKYVEIRGKRLIPSAIYFKEADQSKWIYGDAALRRGIIYPDALFKHFKRHIGESSRQTFHVEPQVNQTAATKRKYIIDTNIFIAVPLILEGMEDDAEVLIPKVVFEELGRRRNVPETELEAKTALEAIDEHSNIVKFEDSHPELLTGDMFRSGDKNNNDRNDNSILSVAFFHDDKNTVLISNDKMLAEKATWQKHSFQVQNYTEFSFYRNLKETGSSPDELKLTGKEGAAVFLKYLRDEICKKIGGYVSRAVITVPQEFSAIQHNEIKAAGYEAGFTEIELQKEPFAAAVAYGLELNEHKTILVYDFGGGTFDVTILEISSDGSFNRIASGGDSKLGGEDFTQALIDDFKDKLISGEILPDDEELNMFEEDNSGLSHDEFVKNELRIWDACEDMKCRLSSSDEDKKIVKLYVKPGEAVDVEYNLSREEFENITAELIERATKALNKILQEANLQRLDIDVVILAGGTSTIPCIAETVRDYFGKEIYADRDPATLIAEGAALFADIKWNQDSTIDKQIKIFDKTMTDFGVSLRGRRFAPIIPVNSALPVKQKKIYSLVKDEQTELIIECYTRAEGSTATVTMNDSVQYIGKVEIKNLPKLKRTEVDVEVIFQLTKEYELAVEVHLKDKRGGEIDRAQVTINTIGV